MKRRPDNIALAGRTDAEPGNQMDATKQRLTNRPSGTNSDRFVGPETRQHYSALTTYPQVTPAAACWGRVAAPGYAGAGSMQAQSNSYPWTSSYRPLMLHGYHFPIGPLPHSGPRGAGATSVTAFGVPASARAPQAPASGFHGSLQHAVDRWDPVPVQPPTREALYQQELFYQSAQLFGMTPRHITGTEHTRGWPVAVNAEFYKAAHPGQIPVPHNIPSSAEACCARPHDGALNCLHALAAISSQAATSLCGVGMARPNTCAQQSERATASCPAERAQNRMENPQCCNVPADCSMPMHTSSNEGIPACLEHRPRPEFYPGKTDGTRPGHVQVSEGNMSMVSLDASSHTNQSMSLPTALSSRFRTGYQGPWMQTVPETNAHWERMSRDSSGTSARAMPSDAASQTGLDRSSSGDDDAASLAGGEHLQRMSGDNPWTAASASPTAGDAAERSILHRNVGLAGGGAASSDPTADFYRDGASSQATGHVAGLPSNAAGPVEAPDRRFQVPHTSFPAGAIRWVQTLPALQLDQSSNGVLLGGRFVASENTDHGMDRIPLTIEHPRCAITDHADRVAAVGAAPDTAAKSPTWSATERERYRLERVQRFLEKRRRRVAHPGLIRYDVRKRLADARPRVRGRFARPETVAAATAVAAAPATTKAPTPP